VGRVLLTELQRALGVVDRESAHEVEHLANFVRRDRLVARGGACVRRGDRGSHQRRLDRSCPAWYRNVRVGANSPSLWPTIASVTYTGTGLRPSCTAIVCPTISGVSVERRDHVLTTRLSPASLRRSILTRRCSSMNGP